MTDTLEALRADKTARYLALVFPPTGPGWRVKQVVSRNAEQRARIAELNEKIDAILYPKESDNEAPS